ncbi:MAG: LON peptidase substrate-binding domain-containing protein, partial [Gemmatimonadota bacterium]|nr:LON peptidase substrate-binding domain-containing protein [Gemmatimonadota bacterium]
MRSTVVFPAGATALQIGFEPNVEALNAHPEPDLIVAIAAVVDDTSPDTPLEPRTLEKVVTATRVLDRLNLPGGTIQTTLQGLRRIRLEDVRLEDGYYTARVREVEETPADPAEAERLVERILNTVVGVAARVERIPDEVPRILRMNLADPSRFADLAASLCQLNVPDRDQVLQQLDVTARLRTVLCRLEETWERVQEIEEEHRAAAGQEEREPAQTPHERRTRIRKQIQSLQAELGELDPAEKEATDLLRRIELAGLPTRVAVVARREVERLGRTGTNASELQEIRTFVETLLSIPWKKGSGAGPLDLEAVRAAMDEKHLGLEEVKRRVLEILSVARLRGTVVGLVPCIVGPPEVG